MAKEYLDKSGLAYLWGKLKAYFQEKLVSGTNIKTINNQSVLGSGNLSIAGSSEVTDVQINSASIVNDGVASIPAASSSSYGVIKAELTSLDPPNPIARFTTGFGPGVNVFDVPRLNSNNKVPTYLLPIADASNVDIGLMDDTLFELFCDNSGDLTLSYNSNDLSTTSITPSKIGAVPTTRKVNNHALSSDITLTASDVGAVPTTRTVNSKALSSNITLAASDVGALPITGGNVSGNVSYKSSSIDASLANNGVSSTQYPTTYNILDKSNRILTRKEAVIESGGNISAYWYVRNYNTSGTQVGQKGIKITMNKSGDVTYGVDDSSKFLSALSMNKYTRSASGHLDWSNQTDGDSKVIMKSALAFWNGRYSGSGSNLEYCTQGRIVGRNQICYANSRVDTFSSGSVTLSLATLGITTGAKPVGILLTPEYSSGVTMKYDYDGSSASGVKIYAYTANGSAYSGALRYFAVVFQNTWTST